MEKNRTFIQTRREFWKTGLTASVLSTSGFAPNFLVTAAQKNAPRPEKDQKILVIVQLAGGNDGLNTVIPYTDDDYYKRRPKIGQRKYHKLNDRYGLNMNLTGLFDMYEQGNLAIVQNVGYPNPNRSHFRSTDIWMRGSTERSGTGWVGRYLDSECPGVKQEPKPVGVNIGAEMPLGLRSSTPHNLISYAFDADVSSKQVGVNMKDLNDMQTMMLLKQATRTGEGADFLKSTYMDALFATEKVEALLNKNKPTLEYEGEKFGRDLSAVASLIASGLSTRVYFVKQKGYDHHANLMDKHPRLLAQLSAGLKSFYNDLKKRGLDKQVVTMTFSEFGRRVSENGSNGTDHGTLAPLFVMGPSVKGGFYGKDLIDLSKVKKDLPFDKNSIDFRRVYSTMLANWLDSKPENVFQKKFESLKILG